MSHLSRLTKMCDMQKGYRPTPKRYPTCAICGNPFEAFRSDAFLCSPRCRQAYSRYKRGKLHLGTQQELHLVRHFNKEK